MEISTVDGGPDFITELIISSEDVYEIIENNEEINEVQIEYIDAQDIEQECASESDHQTKSDFDSDDSIPISKLKFFKKRKKRVSVKQIIQTKDVDFLQEKDLPYVIDTTVNVTPFKCRYCKERSNRLSTLMHHIHKTHKGKRIPTGDTIMYRCQDCYKIYPKHGPFIKHRMSHMNLAVQNPHSCHICGKSFEFKYMVKRHVISSHSSTTPYQCDICKRYFGQKSHLDRHVKRHFTEEMQCEHCDMKFKNRFHFQCHIKTHDNDRPFKCHLCKKTYYFKFHLDSHLKQHEKTGGLKCDICKKFVSTKTNLQRHYKAHSERPGIPCKLCDSVYMSKQGLMNHIKEVHMSTADMMWQDFDYNINNTPFEDNDPIVINEFNLNMTVNSDADNDVEAVDDEDKEPENDNTGSEDSLLGIEDVGQFLEMKTETFDDESIKAKYDNASKFLKEVENPHKCDICQKTFKYKSKLTLHIEMHNLNKDVICKYCNLSFTSQRILNMHMSTHREKYHQCTLCSKSFRNITYLKQHITAHDGAKPFKCTKCDKSFAYQKTLFVHSKLHLGIKPFVCSYCDKTFSQRTGLKNHVATHTREGDFLCDYCSKNFVLKSQLKRHISRSHLKIKPFKCEMCGVRFSEMNLLKRHLTTVHSEKNSIVCTVCNRRYSNETKLELHLEKSPRCQKNHVRTPNSDLVESVELDI